MGWQDDVGLTTLANDLQARPRRRPASVLFAPSAQADDPTLPAPQFVASSDSPLTGPMRGGVSSGPEFAALRNSIIGRSNLNADLQGSQGPRLSQIFNGGAQSSPDIAIPATDGTPPGPGHRRTISADGGPSFWQAVRPEERGRNGQDLLRQGASVAEIQAAHPGWSATQQINLYRQGQQDAAQAARQNFAVGNESANRNAGIMSNQDFHAQDRNTIDRQRLELEAYNHSPEGIRARAEAAGLAALVNNPATAPKNPADLVRILQGASQGGLFRGGFAGFSGGTTTGRPGAGAPTASAPTGNAPPVTLNPGAQGRPANATGYDPSAVDSGGPGPSYAALEHSLDAIRSSLPATENTIGTMLHRLNRDNPAMVRENPAAIRAYLQDKFGQNSYRDAAHGVTMVGGMPIARGGFWSDVFHTPRVIGNAIAGNTEWTPDLEGRALLRTLEGMRNQAR